MRYFALFSLLSFWVYIRSNNSTVLYVGGLFELSNCWFSPYASSFVHILRYAFDKIQQREDLLPGFTFELVTKDTKCNAGYAAQQLACLAEEDPPKVAVIGPSLSNSLTVTGQIAPFYNLIEMSCVATTATTVDRSLFPTLFKVNQVTDMLNHLRIKLMKQFGWTRVGTISSQHDIDVSQTNLFHELLYQNNMTLVTSAILADTTSVKSIISAFKQFDVRIIMGSFYGDIGIKVFCEAYHQGLYGAAYVWILSGPLLHRGWLKDSSQCTLEELYQASDGHFTLENLRNSDSNVSTISGLTPMEEMANLKQLIANSNTQFSSSSGWVYDTAWALALGLNNSFKYLNKKGLSLHNYTANKTFLEALVRGMFDVEFTGVSGPVSFDSSGSRIGVTYLQQNIRDVGTKVASFDLLQDSLTWNVPQMSIWRGNRIPRDSFEHHEHLVEASTAAAAIVIVLDVLGILASLGFLSFNIYYRRNRSIKLSSPSMNLVILLGCLLLYSTVLANAFEYLNILELASNNLICMVRVWIMSLGFTSLFGALFSKTYRVYKIFVDHTIKQKFIKDFHLFGMIMVMLVIDLIILLPWTITSPNTKAKWAEISMDVSDHNIIYSVIYYDCTSRNQAYWLGAIYVYKGLLLSFGTFLAWETRQVSIPELNDSKYIGACIYNVVIVCFFGVPLAYLLPAEQVTLMFVIQSLLIIFCTTVCQCIIFIPKIQNRNKVFGKMLITSSQPEAGNSSTVKSDDGRSKSDIEKENKKLRMEMAQESVALAKLRKQLLEITGNVHFYKSGTEYVVFKRDVKMSIRDVTLQSVESPF